MKKTNIIVDSLIKMIPDAKCELNYDKDYELLIATMLSAQTTDKRVNEVTEELFHKYTLPEIAELDVNTLEQIIKPVGTFRRKSIYLKKIASSLVKDYEGVVPNNRNYIESLPGCGHKTCNVVLSNIYNENCIAVDTHVSRVSKRLGLVKESDNVDVIEKKLTKQFSFTSLKDLHHRMVLFGRYICTAKKPQCNNCLLKDICKNKKTLH